jgi:hypothetical protein
MIRLVAICIAIATLAFSGQDRFGEENPRLRGFAKSPTEHVMNEYPDAIVVRSLRGRITEAAAHDGVPDALVEIKLTSGRVRGVRTDRSGAFRLGGVPDGEYLFKVTRDGFQSVFGRLRVSTSAPRKSEIRVELKQGF